MNRHQILGLGAVTALAIATSAWATSGALGKAEALTGNKWINTKAPIDLEARKGKVTIVHFWTFGCINCKHNLPIYNRWNAKFADKGVTIVGVHTPETASERIESNVRSEVKRQKIAYPVLIDTDEKNWRRWGLEAWPTVFLIDKKGKIRRKWEGELNYGGQKGEEQLTAEIEKLLAE